MNLGSKASTYAILATIEIARHQNGNRNASSMRAAEIAKHFNLPAAYAAKVMTQLVRANILHSDRGPRGGFRLTRSPEDISVLEIVEAVDGGFDVEPGMLAAPETRDALLGVNAVFQEAVERVRELLKTRSVAGFIGPAPVERTPEELPQLSH
jgi:Rrf2 family protein